MDQLTDALDHLYDVAGQSQTVLLTTVSPQGLLHTRPMWLPPRNPALGDLWLVSRQDTAKVHDLSEEAAVGITAFDPQREAYVSVSARARATDNHGELRPVWHEHLRKWFANGPDDDSLQVIRVRVLHVEFAEQNQSPLTVLSDYAKAMLKGQVYKGPGVDTWEAAS